MAKNGPKKAKKKVLEMLFIDEKHDTYTLMESCWWALGGCCSGWQSAGSRHPEMLGKYPLAAPFVFIQIYLFWFCTIWYYKKYTLAAPFVFIQIYLFCVQFDIIRNIPWWLHLFFTQIYLFCAIWYYRKYPLAAPSVYMQI